MIHRTLQFLIKNNSFKLLARKLGIHKVPKFVQNHLDAFHIYPLNIPSIDVQAGLDFLLLELPPRYMPFMPNGLGYVHNILKTSGVTFQTIDINIIFYHRFHSHRILERKAPIRLLNGDILPEDPWDNTNTADWQKPEIINYFWPQIEPVIHNIAKQRPKIVGISLNGNNRALATRFVKALKEQYPEVIIVVGGYDCVYRHVATSHFADFDYMIIREAETTLGPLVKALVNGERPNDLPGIVAQHDSSNRVWEEAPIFTDLDSVHFPKYEWTDTVLYQTFTGNHLIPVMTSRGCNWGRCRFCAECFVYRHHSAERVVEEIEFFVAKGFHTFHFNDSDCNGNPQLLYDICSKIIERGLKLQLIGQLRVDKRNTVEYLRHLARAGFKHLRFGVDGWSDHILKLQRKGYNMKLVEQNLRDCSETEIHTTVNMVMGIPGETDADIDEMIANIVRCKNYIDMLEGVNTLILAAGSEYYMNPDKYNIRFRGDKNDIYQNHPHYVPTELWYSEDPYIDQKVRVRRLDKICTELYKQGVNIGPFATRVVKDLKKTEGYSSLSI